MDSTTATARVACACGTQLRIRPQQLGKRVKCPACGAGVNTSAESAAPAAPVARTGLEGLSPGYRLQPRRWLEVAWPHCRAILGPSVGYLLLFSPPCVLLLLLLWGPLALLLSSSSSERSIGLVLLPFGLAANLIVLPALAMGLHVVCQAQLLGKPWSFATFFSGFRWTWPLAGRAALLFVAEMVLLLPGVAVLALCQLVEGEPSAAVVGVRAGLLLANLLFSGCVLLRLMFFSHLLIIDRCCGPIQALRGSWLLSRGHFWGLYGLLMLVLLLPLLGLGVLVALPVVILTLNAGYLLVAGSVPLSDQRPEAMPLASRRSMGSWLPLAAVAVGVVLFGLWMGWSAHAAQVAREEEMARRRKQDEARQRQAAEASRFRINLAAQEVDELVSFFREGGCWSLELFWLEEPAVPAGSAPPGAAPPGRAGGGAMGGAEIPRRILVLGPRNLRQARSSAPGPGWADVLRRLDELRARGEERQLFHQRFADALSRGEVEAVLVEMTHEPAGGPTGAGGLSAAPGAGSPLAAAWKGQGTSVPLDRAVPLSRERFLTLIEDRRDSP